MKLLCFFVLALLFATPCVFAQDIDPALQDAITKAVPPDYKGLVALGLLLIAAAFRYFTARQNGLSPLGAVLATLKGTNVPPKVPLLIGCLGMLTLSACAPLTAFMASNAGQATVALAELGLNVAAAKGKITPGDNVAIQRGLAIVTNPADPTSVKVFSIAELGLQAAVARGAIKQGDALIIQEGAAIIKSAIIAPQPVEAKQPVNVKPVTVSHAEDDGPGCMQLAERIPDYGYRVAFALSTGSVRN